MEVVLISSSQYNSLYKTFFIKRCAISFNSGDCLVHVDQIFGGLQSCLIDLKPVFFFAKKM